MTTENALKIDYNVFNTVNEKKVLNHRVTLLNKYIIKIDDSFDTQQKAINHVTSKKN